MSAGVEVAASDSDPALLSIRNSADCGVQDAIKVKSGFQNTVMMSLPRITFQWRTYCMESRTQIWSKITRDTSRDQAFSCYRKTQRLCLDHLASAKCNGSKFELKRSMC